MKMIIENNKPLKRNERGISNKRFIVFKNLFFSRTYYICVSMCKYECVRRAAKRLNFREVADEDDWNIYWTDTSVGIERVAQMKKWQVGINRLIVFLD
jgi:hypothetical protein